MIFLNEKINIHYNTNASQSGLPKKNTKIASIFGIKSDDNDKKSTARKALNIGIAVTSALLLAELICFKGKHLKQGFNFIKNKLNFSSKPKPETEPIKYVTDAHRWAHPTNISGTFNSEFAKTVDAKIRELPQIGESRTVYRGITQNYLYNNPEYEALMASKAGDVIQPHKGFSFYAYDERIANHFASSIDTGKILLKVNIPPEAKLSLGKRELISPLGATYKILEKSTHENNLVEILANYIV